MIQLSNLKFVGPMDSINSDQKKINEIRNKSTQENLTHFALIGSIPFDDSLANAISAYLPNIKTLMYVDPIYDITYTKSYSNINMDLIGFKRLKELHIGIQRKMKYVNFDLMFASFYYSNNKREDYYMIEERENNTNNENDCYRITRTTIDHINACSANESLRTFKMTIKFKSIIDRITIFGDGRFSGGCSSKYNIAEFHLSVPKSPSLSINSMAGYRDLCFLMAN